MAAVLQFHKYGGEFRRMEKLGGNWHANFEKAATESGDKKKKTKSKRNNSDL